MARLNKPRTTTRTRTIGEGINVEEVPSTKRTNFRVVFLHWLVLPIVLVSVFDRRWSGRGNAMGKDTSTKTAIGFDGRYLFARNNTLVFTSSWITATSGGLRLQSTAAIRVSPRR